MLNQLGAKVKEKTDLDNIELSNNPLVRIENFIYWKPNILRCIHLFITMEDDEGKCYALDGTMNTIMEKNIYLKLLNADIISEISNAEVISFLMMYRKNNLGNFISTAEYLCFPKEITEGVKKYIKTN